MTGFLTALWRNIASRQVSAVATKPSKLSHAEAASVPISGRTAWLGLLDRAQIKSGERVLVHGGAGAVGAYVVQLFAMEVGARQMID
jgi:NADPH:quinone reductase-like Zn-dependent oxidoreductase